MELIEREIFLEVLEDRYVKVLQGDGHCVFISGEAGIGKTSLVKYFCRQHETHADIYVGTCDAMFTPRPLAPLYDIAMQIRSDLPGNTADLADKNELFGSLLQELSNREKVAIVVFEDIHWADEATLDFIKFLARRITRVRCLFLLTYRDDEINILHPLRNVLGQIPSDSFSRMQLKPLSREAVENMSKEKGYKGEEVFSISGGNPFYVNEILASYSFGIPENIKDSILSVFNKHNGITKELWKLLSVVPTGFEFSYLEKIEPEYAPALEACITAKILLVTETQVSFKHELYRRTVEASLSPLERVSLNKRILNLFRESFEKNHEIERIIHHAKSANDYDLVVHYAPLAAKQAASLGAHLEASKLYFSAIEYYQGNDKDKLLELYESYAYECYLTSQVNEAIIYQGKCLIIWKEKNDIERTGNCLRFLSRLWWFAGNRKQAEIFCEQSIEVLNDQPSSKAKAMAFSNMSQLKMLADQTAEAILWGEKAIAMSQELNDEETLTHALNNVGSALMRNHATKQKGTDLLQQSLAIALENSFHEHVARAYTNLGADAVVTKDYEFAKKNLDAGIHYSEERDLNSWTSYMLSWKARLNLETGKWSEAQKIAGSLLQNQTRPPVVKINALVVVAIIKMRKGEDGVLPLLKEAISNSLEIGELQRILPVFAAALEYEWIKGENFIEKSSLDRVLEMLKSEEGNLVEKSDFSFWLLRARREYLSSSDVNGKESTTNYTQALRLFDGNEDDKRKAITMVQAIGADAVYEKLKMEMRNSGIKSIPRGLRKSTSSNPALLTNRELDILQLLKEGMQNKELAGKLYISAKTVDHHISSILFKLEVNSRVKAVQEAMKRGIIK